MLVAVSILGLTALPNEAIAIEEIVGEYTTTVVTVDRHDEPREPTEYDRLYNLSPEERITYFSEKYGVEPSLAIAIARCESGFVATAKNPSSSASGMFQFINSTWASTMNRMGLPTDTPKTDPVLGTMAGVWLLSVDGVVHWEESRSCWG